MEQRDIILTVVFTTFGVILIVGVSIFLFYWCHRRKRKTDEENTDDEDQMNDGGRTIEKKNGFLSLRTPLISTKALGYVLILFIFHYKPSKLKFLRYEAGKSLEKTTI
ncbi:hypothetical protein RUM43_001227 [Polyplax serrata]|uniref:Uncharacterized protein n=1 Tax=Polyplax serrata TaxID=468196 RepID=A0AAN8XRR2_POLSC